MPKISGKKSEAAKRREATKRGEILAPEDELDPSIQDDPTYQSDLSDVELPIVSESVAAVSEGSTSQLAQKRRERRENADIMPERLTATSRTTGWRDQKGKTAKARAKNFQKSIADLFKKKPSKENITKIDDTKKQEEEEDTSVIATSPNPLVAEDSSSFDLTSTSDDVQQPASIDVDLISEPEESVLASDFEVPEAEFDLSDVVLDTAFSVPPSPQTLLEQSSSEDSESHSQDDIDDSSHTTMDIDARISKLRPDSRRLWPKADHDRLNTIIEKHRTNLRNKKTLITDATAANTLIDLEALKQYNGLRFKLSNEIVDLQKQLALTPRRLKHNIKKRMNKIRPALDASNSVAGRCARGPFFAKTLRSMSHELFTTGRLPENNHGKGAHHETLLNRPGVSSALQAWVKGGLSFEEGGYLGRMRPAKLRRYVNSFLFPQMKIERTISESTAVRWLKTLGFKLSRVQKGVYVDGHERADVVAARTEFINYMYTQVLPYSYAYEGEALVEIAPDIPEGIKIHYPIYHDETCIHANDLDNYVWMREGEQPLRNKSRGRIIHVSDFIIEHCGRLFLTEEEISIQMKLPVRPSRPPEQPTSTTSTEATVTSTAKGKGLAKKAKNSKKATSDGRTFTEQENEWVPPPPPAPFKSYRVSSFDARRIIYPGSNYDPWWDMPQLIAQTKDAIEIFETKYPDGIAVFIFDCSSAHEAYPSDALLAHKMNRGPGGKQPLMRDTVMPSTGLPQSMVFPPEYSGLDKDGNSLAGKPKGMEQVLRERGLLSILERKHGHKLVGVCNFCKQSQAARDAAIKSAKSKEDEIEGSGTPSLNSRGVSSIDEDDLVRPRDCCMQRVLSLEKDFREEKPLLQLVIEKAGHKCLFLPKFHCELNPIEMVWGQTKQRFREYADGTFPTAKKLVLECLDNVSIANIRRYFRHCWRYLDAYKRGLNIRQAAYAVKKFSSHRRIPGNIVMDINIIRRGATG